MGNRAGVRVLNLLHRRLPLVYKRRLFYWLGEEAPRVDTTWWVDFAGRLIALPLRQDFRLAWTAALGFHGYDAELHVLYEALVRSPRRPRVVFDVGANYGLHALRFLAVGARAVAFEPNPACHQYFRECCALNGLAAEIHAVAVAEARGSARLMVPGDATYLGTIVPAVGERWAGRPDVTTMTVPQVTLDDVVEEHGEGPDLVKIDTEGSELAVLQGAVRVLQRRRPLVVFESWPSTGDRAALFDLLDRAGYGIQAVGWPLRDEAEMAEAAFVASRANNFLARPRGARLSLR
ncbi:MAG: FkbM family methyltransferase [Candidatus Rokuibacteriota bacterium]